MASAAPQDILKGQRILVTGASSGLGLAMATALAEAGATVVLAARGLEQLARATTTLKKQGGDVQPRILDVRDESAITATMEWIHKQLGGLDMLVNNAGIGMRTVNPAFLTTPKPFHRVATEAFTDMIATNVTGYFLMAKAVVPLFLAQGRGKIVNIGISHETMQRQGFIPYGPSRAATESMSAIMAEDLRDDHIDVNLLLPGGATDTGMIPDDQRDAIPLLSPAIMAEPIVFLASAAADGISGERLIAREFTAWLRDRGLKMP